MQAPAQPKRRPGRPKGSKNKKPRAASAKHSAKRPVNNNTGAAANNKGVVKRGRRSSVKRGGADRVVFGGCSNIRVQNLFKKGIEIAQQNSDSRLLMVYYDKNGKNVTFYGSKCDDNDWVRECRKIHKHASKPDVGVYGINTFDYDRLFGEYYDNASWEVIKGDWRNLRHLHGGIEQKVAEDAARGAQEALRRTQEELERQQACAIDLEVVSMYPQANTEDVRNTELFVSASAAAVTELAPVRTSPVPHDDATTSVQSESTAIVPVIEASETPALSPRSTGLELAGDLIEQMVNDVEAHAAGFLIADHIPSDHASSDHVYLDHAFSDVALVTNNDTSDLPIGSPASRADVKRSVFDTGDAHWLDCLISPQRMLAKKMRSNIFRRW